MQKELEAKKMDVDRLHTEMVEFKVKYEEMFDENDQLRQGTNISARASRSLRQFRWNGTILETTTKQWYTVGTFFPGMHEILDLIRDQDGKSDVRIHTESLEKIISVLDARHLWGDFHPAMELKTRIEKLEGINAGE